MLKPGIKAPEIALINQNNEKVYLNDFLGKKVIVYFYPKDDTPGCTTQACKFRDSFEEFKNKDIVIIGISADSVESHQKFIEKYNLPFILLSDPNHIAINKYEVWVEKSYMGKKYMGINRTTYLINEKGEIMWVFENAKPDTNADEILAFIEKNN